MVARILLKEPLEEVKSITLIVVLLGLLVNLITEGLGKREKPARGLC
jgi:hypothetical protein